MTHSVTLNIPDHLYDPLLEKANQTGKKPEELMIEYLQTMIKNTEDDPVEEFIGAIDSDISDWTKNHELYLGKSLSEE
ncbi:hypothetical protein [Crocosphaera sp. Alani8]|uniref:hypothetical protein n=1 Tax=Crocosphaera sp. Alani8 TaxID=3038952 RepID=UPI00313E8C07